MTDFASTSKLATPIFPAICYPTHCLYVPLDLWGVNLLVSSFGGFVVGQLRDTGIDTVVVVIVGLALHCWFMVLYHRDPFCVTVVLAKRFRAKPFPPRPFLMRPPTRNLVPRKGQRIRLS